MLPSQLRWSLLALFAVAVAAPARAQEDVNEANEKAMKAASKAAAPWVVKIETAGGREVIGGGAGPRGPAPGIRKGTGPTTGVVVDKDGYVISSAFNFANNPTDIFITVPGKPRVVAKVIANDTSRMLTLLKVDLKDLPVPTAFPKKDMRVGQWSLALGRTLDPEIADVPSMSVGILSALGRIWGKAVQTDAKVSPVNYGGPLVAIDGRVFGVLVPASPQGEGDTAGVEWYDSGIGFAIPLEDIFAALPRLKDGKNLRRGLLGITMQTANDQYLAAVVVGTVSPDSAAARAGLKPGDKIVKVDDKPVNNYSQLMHILGPKYEGDALSLVVVRDGKEMPFNGLTLSGVVTAFTQPYLGILPMRDDPEPGVEIRYVYPKSPAETAKLAAGDRIMKIAPAGTPLMQPIQNRAAFAQLMTRLQAGGEVKIEVKKKDGKTETVTTRLAALPDEVAEKAPLPSSKGKALEKPKGVGPMPPMPPKKEDPKKEEPKKDEKKDDEKKDEIETGLLKKTSEVLGREYWVYLPHNYDKNISYGVIVWLHGAGKGGKDADDMVGIWRDFCEDNKFILVGPKSKTAEGWVASEAEEIVQIIKDAMAPYTIDRTRVVVHGMGIGGQMGFYLGFHARDLVRGVATTGAVLGNQPKDNLPGQPLAFYIIAGEKDPLVKEIAESKPKLTDKKFPVIYKQLAEFGKEYLDTKTLDELQRWMDSLDRI